MTKQEIINTIKSANAGLSAKGIAHYAKIDPMSENLQDIQDACFELCNEGKLLAADCRGPNAMCSGWFFNLAP